MATPSSRIHGLNIIDPPPEQNGNFVLDGSDLLAGAPPEMTAQLDLWTNLAFQSDEPLPPKGRPAMASSKSTGSTEGSAERPKEGEDCQNFDLDKFLAGFGIDPYLVPPVNTPPQNQTNLANLANYLSTTSSPTSPTTPHPSTSSSTDDAHAAKRARITIAPARKTSVDTDAMASPEDQAVAALAVAEDKRRRNTAASARFRAKKKEREAALEQRSKELETRLTTLERECEALRRENGWLKGLVVGATTTGATLPPPTPSSSTSSVPNAKRKRSDAQPLHDRS